MAGSRTRRVRAPDRSAAGTSRDFLGLLCSYSIRSGPRLHGRWRIAGEPLSFFAARCGWFKEGGGRAICRQGGRTRPIAWQPVPSGAQLPSDEPTPRGKKLFAARLIRGALRPERCSASWMGGGLVTVTIQGPFQVGHELVLKPVQRPLLTLFCFHKKKKRIALAGRVLFPSCIDCSDP